MNTARNTGATSKQLLSAPKDAFFIWNNEFPQYVISLAESLHREDLTILRASALLDLQIAQLVNVPNAIIIDHALRISPELERNINRIKVSGRTVSQEVIDPAIQPEKLTADVMAWSVTGTGLIIRGVDHAVRARLKYAPGQINMGPTEIRDNAMALMQRLADTINQRSTFDEGIVAPSQEKRVDMDRDEALKVVINLLSDAKTPRALKKKFADSIGPLL